MPRILFCILLLQVSVVAHAESGGLVEDIMGTWYKESRISPTLCFEYNNNGEQTGWFRSDSGNVVDFYWKIEEVDTLIIEYSNGNVDTFQNVSVENDCLSLELVDYESSYEIMYRTPDYIVYSSGNYSEGLAWIMCGDFYTQYWACIDKTGTGLFHFSAEDVKEVTPFSKGYAYIKGDDYIAIIDQTGKVMSKYLIDEYNFVLAYGDGYILTEEFVSDFSSSGYVIRLCDYAGTVIAQSSRAIEGIETSYDIEEESSVGHARYCGKGVFGVSYPMEGTAEYFTSAGEVLIQSESSDKVSYFYDDLAVWDFEQSTGQLTLMNVNGEIVKYVIDANNLSSFDCPVLGENICVLRYGIYEGLGLFKLNTQQVINLDKYTSQIYWDKVPDTLRFVNGCIVLPFKGQDGNMYVGMFDTEWNVILEPVLAYNYAFSNGLLIVNDGSNTYLYDNTGEMLFSFAMGNQTYSGFSDGVSRFIEYQEGNYVYYADEATYIDSKGKRLFDSVDMLSSLYCSVTDIENIAYGEIGDSPKKQIQTNIAMTQKSIIQESADTGTNMTVSGFFTDESVSSVGSYILPQSSSVYLSENDLEHLTLKGLCYAKNEIYARYGRKFISAELSDYFNQQTWYSPIYEANEANDQLIVSLMNDYERYNKDIISAIEQKMGPYVLEQ